MASLKETIAKKHEEIERLQLLKDLKNGYTSINGEQRGTGSLRYGSSSILLVVLLMKSKLSGGKGLGIGHTEKAASDHDNCSQ